MPISSLLLLYPLIINRLLCSQGIEVCECEEEVGLGPDRLAGWFMELTQ